MTLPQGAAHPKLLGALLFKLGDLLGLPVRECGTRSLILANPPAIYRSLSGPPGPKSQKSLKKVCRGRRPRGTQESEKSLEKVPNRHFQTFQTFSGLFQDFSGPRGRRPRETFFFRLFGGISGPEGPRDSCSSREGTGSLIPSSMLASQVAWYQMGTGPQGRQQHEGPKKGNCPRSEISSMSLAMDH